MFTLQNTDSSLLTTDTAMTTVMYPVMELFYTLQGEGCFTGHAAIFIRLAGCNVGCHWCDVKESWDADKYLAYSIPDILLQVQQFPANGCYYRRRTFALSLKSSLLGITKFRLQNPS